MRDSAAKVLIDSDKANNHDFILLNLLSTSPDDNEVSKLEEELVSFKFNNDMKSDVSLIPSTSS